MSSFHKFVFYLLEGEIICYKDRVSILGKIDILIDRIPNMIRAYAIPPASIRAICAKRVARIVVRGEVFENTKEAREFCKKLLEVTSRCTGTTDYWRSK